MLPEAKIHWDSKERGPSLAWWNVVFNYPDFSSWSVSALYVGLAASCPHPLLSSSVLLLIIIGHFFKPGLFIFNYNVSKAVNHVSAVEKFTIVTFWVVGMSYSQVINSFLFDEFPCFFGVFLMWRLYSSSLDFSWKGVVKRLWRRWGLWSTSRLYNRCPTLAANEPPAVTIVNIIRNETISGPNRYFYLFPQFIIMVFPDDRCRYFLCFRF
jgi:hypothetical protein